MPYEAVTTVLTAVGVLVSGGGLVFVAAQVQAAKEQIRLLKTVAVEEDARRKRQETIDFYMVTINQVTQWREKLPDDWDAAAIKQVVDEAYKTDDQKTKRLIASYLGFFETLAVAEEEGVYDLKTLDAIAGSRLANISTNYRPFFEKRRKEVGATSAYVHLVELGNKIGELPHRIAAREIAARQQSS